ncbi:MAG: M28 family peptidase [Woeseiaceae bacterium]
MNRILVIAGLLLALSACAEKAEEVATTGNDPLDLITQENLYAHLEYLSSDDLEGREAGTAGYDAAAKYVAEQFAAIGLEPGGTEGWYQPVELQKYLVDQESAAMIVHRDDENMELVAREDFVMSGDKVRSEDSVRGEVVFVGFGVHAPELGYSDLDGVDLEGKIVAYFSRGPQSIKGDKLAHYSSFANKSREWANRGAVGVIFMFSRLSEESSPWDRFKETTNVSPSQTWISVNGEAADYVPELKGYAYASPDVARKMFEGAPISFDEARAKADASEVTSVPLGVEVTLRRNTAHERITSPNVVGLLRGTDPELADEYVIYTAHLDHEGRTTAPVNGDDINNGMYDNAMGTGIMIEAARALAANPPRRSVLFIALTAEEKGLLGSDYFANYPTVPTDSIVANVNMDMPLFLFPTDEVVAFGAEHSSLGAVAEQAASAEGFSLVPDQLPEEVLFSRSDQFSFVRQGITAIWLDSSIESSDPDIDGPAVIDDHLKNHYHKPSDDLTRPIVWEDALSFTRANARIGWLIANDDERPTWNDDSFYGNLYAPKQ